MISLAILARLFFSAASAYLLPLSFMHRNMVQEGIHFLWRLRQNTDFPAIRDRVFSAVRWIAASARAARIADTSRLACGRIAMLSSTTWEEATTGFGQWLPQRTRWLKGWMITLLVHTRQPGRLLGDLGVWRTFGLLALVGGMLLSSLVHLGFYLLIAGYV